MLLQQPNTGRHWQTMGSKNNWRKRPARLKVSDVIIIAVFIALAISVVGIVRFLIATPTVPLGTGAFLTEPNSVAKKSSKDVFPPPVLAAGENARILLEPTFGTHHPKEDAVFVFAEGYELPVYALFVVSLRHTGFVGDIVMSVSSQEKLKPGVEEFLRRKEVVTYCLAVHASGGKIDGMYGDQTGAPLPDPRASRPVATARFELYWAWSLRYQPHSRIMLADARDVYFQSSPFVALPRTPSERSSGSLHFFEENSAETSAAQNIGGSQFNSNWIRRAYGQDALDRISNRTVICSGGSIGDQVAIEAYLRAMVKQYDDRTCNMKGCDQGYHNFLYYSGLLNNLPEISGEVTVHRQGEGMINNLAALRNLPLREQGILQEKTGLVLNWDGSVSPVVHQFDRDKELGKIMKERTARMVSDFKNS